MYIAVKYRVYAIQPWCIGWIATGLFGASAHTMGELCSYLYTQV